MTTREENTAGNAFDAVTRCKYAGCLKVFSPSRPWQEFCSTQCRNNHHNQRQTLHEKVRERRAQSLKPGTKLYRVLTALAEGSRFNRFQAERELHDHCLHSTIADLQTRHGVFVHRVDEVVSGFQGAPTHVAQYWLDDDNMRRARELLGRD